MSEYKRSILSSSALKYAEICFSDENEGRIKNVTYGRLWPIISTTFRNPPPDTCLTDNQWVKEGNGLGLDCSAKLQLGRTWGCGIRLRSVHNDPR